MATQLLFANDAQSTLAGGISNVATTANLAAGTGALFPNPAANQYFVMTFTDRATGLVKEIIHVTERSGDAITIVRAQEGTSAVAWLAGDLADSLVTAGQMAEFSELDAANTFTAQQTMPSHIAQEGTTATLAGGTWADIITSATTSARAACYTVTAQSGNGYGATARFQVSEFTINKLDELQTNVAGPTFRVNAGKIQVQHNMASPQPVVWATDLVSTTA